MSFFQAYKRLDNLCKDMFQSDKGVTTYIETMESTSSSQFKPSSWDSDYKTLKHYRHIRNQIAHDNFADESSMSNEEDEKWIELFYTRILNDRDPLALYKKAFNLSQSKSAGANNVVYRSQASAHKHSHRHETASSKEARRSSSSGISLGATLTVIGIIALVTLILVYLP